MKILNRFLLFCFLAVLVACSEDAFVPQSEGIPTTNSEFVDLISMTVPDIEMADATTRSILYEDGDEMKFVWQENDAIGVVPMSGNPLNFPIHAENIQKNTAVFDGGDWALKTNTKYAAFFPIEANNQKTDIKNISIDYTGQTQGNWMDYDFLATGAVQPKDGAVRFTMQRLSAILKIKITAISGDHYRYATLVAPEAVFGVKGTLDLSGSEPVYTPEGLSRFMTTDAGVERIFTSNDTIIFYMMIPPTDLSGKQLKLQLVSDEGYGYERIFSGKNYEAGKAYLIDVGVADLAHIRNTNLIEKAGLSSYVGSDGIEVDSNRDRILQVKKINVSKLDDPTVCDEIGFFRNLEELTCYGNGITSLDVSNNPNLTYLSCGTNELTSLDLSNNKALKTLYCDHNQFASLDLSHNIALTDFSCEYNDNVLGSLDLSNNSALTTVYCDSVKIESLNISNNPALKYLRCRDNRLTSLDVSSCTILYDLECDYNRLTSLDVSNNTLLNYLSFGHNQLTSVDVSKNTALTGLYPLYNQLTSLDISNNTALKSLNCSYNQLTSLDLSNNMALNFVACSGNLLDSLIITDHPSLERLSVGNTGFKKLDCHGNALTALSIYDCSNSLTDLNCSNNALKSRNVSYYTALTELRCTNNNMTSLTVTGCTALKELYCSRNLMSTLDITTCTDLKKSMVVCGSQFTNEDKTVDMTLTLYARAADTTSLRFTSSDNKNVTVVNQ